MATVSPDPESGVNKLHVRYYWNHADVSNSILNESAKYSILYFQDEEFQAKCQREKAVKIDPSKPDWLPMQRGFALTLENLKDFLETEFADMLLGTFVDKNGLKKSVEDVVTYLCSKKEELIPIFFQEYRKLSKKDMAQSLKNLLSEYISNHPDFDFMRVARELPVILSLLYLKQEGYIGLF